MIRLGRRKLKWAGVFALISLLGAVTLVPHIQALYVPVSPNPDRFVDLRNNNTGDNSLDHVLKKESNQSTIDRIEVAAYYDSASPTHYIQLTDQDTSGVWCSIYDPGDRDNSFVIVTLTIMTKTGPQVVRYPIRSDRICEDNPSNATNPAPGTGGYNAGGTRFFARFQVPSQFTAAAMDKDEDTQLYKVSVSIAYDADVPDGNGDNRQQFVFKIRTNGCAGGTVCDRYLSTVPIAGGRNYSTLGPNGSGSENNQHYTRQTFSFGLPCKETASSVKRVYTYDLDNNGGNGAWNRDTPQEDRQAYFYIQRRDDAGDDWIPLSPGEYTTVRSSTPGTRNGIPVMIPFNGGNVDASVDITMQPFTNYQLVVQRIWSGNLVGVGLPTETIFGDLVCDPNLSGRINADPNTSPIEVGRDITLSAESFKTNNASFNSEFAYSWRTWYDTGDSVHQPGETPGCPYRNNVQRTHPLGTQNMALESCTMRSDSTRSGGNASAVCAQLIMSATDDRTGIAAAVSPPNGLTRCVKIGKYPHMEIRNGDLFSGGALRSPTTGCAVTRFPKVTSSQRTIDGNTYTSYATYGVTGLGEVDKFGSQGLNFGAPSSDYLVFANPPAATQGFFLNIPGNTELPTVPHCINDPFAIFGPLATATSPATTIDLSAPGTESVVLTADSNVYLTASGPIPAGKKIVIRAPNANINIMSNIVYEDIRYDSINKLPQVVILGEHSVIVHRTVRQIDGIFASKKNFFTCNRTPKLNGDCRDQLVVNGAVIAGDNVVPARGAGAERPDYGQMAEIFNLSPDVLLNQLPESGGGDVYVRTVSETELPPRF